MWDHPIGMRIEKFFKYKWLFNITLRMSAYLQENSHNKQEKFRLNPTIEGAYPGTTIVYY